MKIKDIGEIGLIKRISRGIKYDRLVVKGIGDDTAVIDWKKDKHLLYTSDMLVEDVHFTSKTASAFQVGWKALGRNISDIAAMGGVPRYAVVSIGIAPSRDVSYLDGIYKGIKSSAKKFGVNIVGGDMSRSPKIVIDISLIGEVEKRNLVLRSGAKVGDMIFVTGSIGGAFKGKHLNFTPRVIESRELVNKFKINSMIDISDGFTLDLWRILDASKVGAKIFKKLIPISNKARSFESAINDGEDFELLFTVNRIDGRRLLKNSKKNFKEPVTLIGEIRPKEDGFVLIDECNRCKPLIPKGYLHFQ